MKYVVLSIVILLVANALIAFAVTFYWQAKVIFTVLRISKRHSSFVPWKDLANPKGANNTLGRFIAGEIFPEMRRNWARAWGYTVLSSLALFLVTGFLQVVAPNYFL